MTENIFNTNPLTYYNYMRFSEKSLVFFSIWRVFSRTLKKNGNDYKVFLKFFCFEAYIYFIEGFRVLNLYEPIEGLPKKETALEKHNNMLSIACQLNIKEKKDEI